MISRISLIFAILSSMMTKVYALTIVSKYSFNIQAMTTRFNDNDLLVIFSRYNPVPSASRYPGTSIRRGVRPFKPVDSHDVHYHEGSPGSPGSPGARSRFLPEVIPSLGHTVSTEMCFSFVPSLEVSCKDQREMEERVKQGDFSNFTQVFAQWLKMFFQTERTADSYGDSSFIRLFGPVGQPTFSPQWRNAQEIDGFPERGPKTFESKDQGGSSRVNPFWFEWLTL